MARVVECTARMGSIARLLRVNGFYLVVASTTAFLMDALGRPIGGIGFKDAHELSLIAGLLLWSAAPRRSWHLAAAAVQALFAASNVAHWQAFVSAEIVPAACVTTFMHVVFVALQCLAARTAAGPHSLPAAPATAWR